jgi:hypothetical protein
MVAVLCATIWMQPYDQMPSLEKMCSIFLYNPNEIFLCGYGGEKKQLKKRKGTMLYVITFGYGRGPTHCNAHT